MLYISTYIFQHKYSNKKLLNILIYLQKESLLVSLHHYPNLVTDILRYIFILMLLRSLFHFTHNKVIENNSGVKEKFRATYFTQHKCF